jgi:hypothetical protein
MSIVRSWFNSAGILVASTTVAWEQATLQAAGNIMNWAAMWPCGPRPGYLSGLDWRTPATKGRRTFREGIDQEYSNFVFLLSESSPVCSCYLSRFHALPGLDPLWFFPIRIKYTCTCDLVVNKYPTNKKLPIHVEQSYPVISLANSSDLPSRGFSARRRRVRGSHGWGPVWGTSRLRNLQYAGEYGAHTD